LALSLSVGFDINVLREEARSRWLKPSEVYYILQNHERFPITHEAPKKPPSITAFPQIGENSFCILFTCLYSIFVCSTGGSLFLYNRRVNRYFRRDGHTWRRKKDGRTVGEAHERLKVYFMFSLYFYSVNISKHTIFVKSPCKDFWEGVV
jgi:hypothetical protein